MRRYAILIPRSSITSPSVCLRLVPSPLHCLPLVSSSFCPSFVDCSFSLPYQQRGDLREHNRQSGIELPAAVAPSSSHPLSLCRLTALASRGTLSLSARGLTAARGHVVDTQKLVSTKPKEFPRSFAPRGIWGPTAAPSRFPGGRSGVVRAVNRRRLSLVFWSPSAPNLSARDGCVNNQQKRDAKKMCGTDSRSPF